MLHVLVSMLIAVLTAGVLAGSLPGLAFAAAAAATAPAPATATAPGFNDLSQPRFQTVGQAGIPRGVVRTVAQDSLGFLWIATGDGLVRFDGHRFTPKERSSAHPAERNLGWVGALHAARDGRMWIATEADGLAVYDPATDRIENHRDGAAGSAMATITALTENSQGQLWVGTAGHGLRHYDPVTRRSTHYRHTGVAGGLPDDNIEALLQDRDGELWIGSGSGLSRKKAGQTAFSDMAGRMLDGQGVQSLMQAADGQLWVGTRKGRLLIVDPATGRARVVHDAQASITALVQAAGGTVWVATREGIHLFDPGGRWLRHLQHDARTVQGLGGNEISSLLLDQTGAIWVGGFGLGLQRHDPQQTALQLRAAGLHGAADWQQPDLRAVLQQPGGELWVAPRAGGVLRLDAGLGLIGRLTPRSAQGSALVISAMAAGTAGSTWLGSDSELQQLAADGRLLRRLIHTGKLVHHLLSVSDGSLWMATRDGLLRLAPGALSPQPVLLSGGKPLNGNVFVSAQDASGAVWVGAASGLYRIHPGQLELQAVASGSTADQGDGNSLANAVVIGLLVDTQQTLWVDTAVAGLHRMTAWNGQRASFDRISLRHGIYSRPFGASLQADGQGRIWTHMHVYDPAADSLHALSEADGMILGTGWFRASARTGDDRLLFAGSNGLLVVTPERFAPPTAGMPLRSAELRLNGQKVPAAQLQQGLLLEPQVRSLSLEFVALDFADPGRSRYSYRLEGFDPDWISTGAEQRLASYSNLDPGNYLLRVRASQRSGVWGEEELRVPIKVLPAWWQQPWFRVVCLLLLAAWLLGWQEWRTGRLRQQRAALKEAVAERTAELQAARDELEHRVKQRTRQLEAASAAAGMAQRAKTAFLHNVSHDMRTPLNAIIGLTHLQQAAAPDATQRAHLGRVMDAATELRGQIEHVLALSLADTGTAALQAAVAAASTTERSGTAGPAGTAGAVERLRGRKLLLAEDDPVNQIVAAGILGNAGLIVDIAMHGDEAVQMAARSSYDLVLMDLQMPVLDGLEATRRIRETEAGRRLPIVAFTAFTLPEDRQRCLDAGMNDLVCKPVEPAVLLATLARWLPAALSN